MLLRATHLQEATEGEAAAMRFRLSRAAGHWTLLGLDQEVLARAGSAFPVEPVRTLDALHLASALVASSAVGQLTVLSLDRRIRECAHALGLELLPE